MTIVHDPRGLKKRALHVADGRGKESLKRFLSGFSAEQRTYTIVAERSAVGLRGIRRCT